ncbi:MAG: hypothetical protein WCB11_11095, partial [Terriglobales bacterium]
MIIRKDIIAVPCTMLVLIFLLTACSKLQKSPPPAATAKPQPTEPSTISVDVKGGGPLTLTTSAAQFE